MHSVGALQSASSKNRVGEQATCNVWQLQLSRLSVYVCVYVMGVCVCVFVFRWGALRHHRRHRREQRTKSRRELVNLLLPPQPACLPPTFGPATCSTHTHHCSDGVWRVECVTSG